jgi:hypothetical protein
VDNFPSINVLLTGKHNFTPENSNDIGFCFAANGCTYRKGKQGFLPALMEKMYNDRVVYKKKMIEAKQELELVEAEMKKRGILLT